MFHCFHSNQYFALSFGLTNSIYNTAIISAVNVWNSNITKDHKHH